MFRRRRRDPSDADQPDIDDVGPGAGDEDDADDGADAGTQADTSAAADRSGGPFDVSEVDDDGITRLDLGGLRVPGVEGMELRLDLDETAERVMSVTVVDGRSGMQLMAFAAPRTQGIWDDVREEIRANLAAGGTVDVVNGPFGPEVRSTVVAEGPQGQSQMQPVRFVGIDGPRWFLRALFTGAAARDAAAAEVLEQVLRATVVVRGVEAMAPGDQLPLQVPEQVPEGMARQGAEGQERPPLSMPERGPEITETR